MAKNNNNQIEAPTTELVETQSLDLGTVEISPEAEALISNEIEKKSRVSGYLDALISQLKPESKAILFTTEKVIKAFSWYGKGEREGKPIKYPAYELNKSAENRNLPFAVSYYRGNSKYLLLKRVVRVAKATTETETAKEGA